VISFCLKTHPGLRVEIPPILNATPTTTTYSTIKTPSAIPNLQLPLYPNQNNSTLINSNRTRNDMYLATSTTSSSASLSTSTTVSPSTTTASSINRSGRYIRSLTTSFRRTTIYNDWQETYGQPHEAFFYVELVCNVWFIIELSVRLVVSNFFLMVHMYSTVHSYVVESFSELLFYDK
jgi:potassium voltage-gated channel Shaw-related subfamily C member 1